MDVAFFCETHCNQNEKIISSIDCLNDGNPFQGTLILTDQRIFFIRKGPPGSEAIGFRHCSILRTGFGIENRMDFILTIFMPTFEHRFTILGLDGAKKNEFIRLVEQQQVKKKAA